MDLGGVQASSLEKNLLTWHKQQGLWLNILLSIAVDESLECLRVTSCEIISCS